MQINKNIYLAFLAIASIVFASILIRYSEVGPIATGGYRLLIAIPILLFADVLNVRQENYKLSKKVLLASIGAGICFGLDLASFNVSILNTTAAESNLLTNMVPFIIAPISIIFFKEKISLKMLVPTFLAIIGLFILLSDNTISLKHFHGDCQALCSAIFYAFFLTCIKIARDNYYTNRIMIIVSLVGVIILFMISIINHESILPHTLYGWLIVIIISICGQIFGQTLFAYTVKFISLQLASILLLCSPIFAEAYAYILFREKLSILQIIGIVFILIAVYYAKNIINSSIKKFN